MHHHFVKWRRSTGALALVVCVAGFLSGGLAWAGEETTVIHKIRIGKHASHTRLVFDASGARPQRIGGVSSDGLSIEFPGLETALEAETAFAKIALDVERVKIHKDESPPRVEVVFRRPGMTVSHELIGSDPPLPGHYRLVLDFYPGKAPKEKRVAAPAAPVIPETPAPPPVTPSPGGPAAKSDSPDSVKASDGAAAALSSPAEKAVPAKKDKRRDKTKPKAEEQAGWKPVLPPVEEPASPPAVSVSPPPDAPAPVAEGDSYQLPAPLRKAYDRLNAGGADNAYQALAQFKEFLKSAPEGKDRLEALYGLADATFAMYESSLAEDGFDVIEKYAEALEAGKYPARAPVAIYRAGLASLALEDLTKAARYFQQLIKEYPTHPLVGSASLRMGKIYQRRKSYAEALQASKTALEKAANAREKAEAEYVLGKTYSLMGNHEAVVQSLERCLEGDPSIYLKYPDLLDTLGESFFVLKKYDQSRQSLLWYLNLQMDVPDRDVILARIAETLMLEGDTMLAQRLHDYIQSRYPNSDGALAGNIRKAEELEKGKEDDLETALTIYTEALKRPLSQSLDRLIHYKTALLQWQLGRYKESLQIIDDVLSTQRNPLPYEEFRTLRGKVQLDWLKRDFGEGNHTAVVERFQENLPLFQTLKAPEVNAMVAESYRSLGRYPEALENYETLVEGDEKKRGETLLTMAQLQVTLGEAGKAAELCRQVSDATLLPRAQEMLGRIYFAENKFGDAAEQFGRLLPKGREPKAEDLDWILSYIESLEQTGKNQEACALVEKSLQYVPEADNDKRFQLLLFKTRCLQRLKQPVETAKIMEETISLAPEDDLRQRLRYELAGLYLDLGRKDKATEKLSEIVKSDNLFWKNAAQQQLNDIQFQEKEREQGNEKRPSS